MAASYLHLITIRAYSLQLEVHLALFTFEARAPRAALTELELVYFVTPQGNQPDSMCDELIVQRTRILADLDEVNRHSWDL